MVSFWKRRISPTLLMAVALAGVSFSHWRALAEGRSLKRRLAEVSHEVGDLYVDDPQSAYFLTSPGGFRQSHRYQVYLPAGRQYELHVRQGSPQVEPTPLTPSVSHPSGRTTIHVDVFHVNGQWHLNVGSSDASPPIRRSIPLENPVVLPQLYWHSPQQKLNPDEPIVLLDHVSEDEGEAKSRFMVYLKSRKKE